MEPRVPGLLPPENCRPAGMHSRRGRPPDNSPKRGSSRGKRLRVPRLTRCWPAARALTCPRKPRRSGAAARPSSNVDPRSRTAAAPARPLPARRPRARGSRRPWPARCATRVPRCPPASSSSRRAPSSRTASTRRRAAEGPQLPGRGGPRRAPRTPGPPGPSTERGAAAPGTARQAPGAKAPLVVGHAAPPGPAALGAPPVCRAASARSCARWAAAGQRCSPESEGEATPSDPAIGVRRGPARPSPPGAQLLSEGGRSAERQ